jgi:hypothetical protein
MALFDEIEKMQGLIAILSPLLADDLGVLVNPDTGAETNIPAIYIANNNLPASTYPRVVLSYNGSSNGHPTRVRSYQENNPDFGMGGEPEFLYFTDHEYHIEYSLNFSVDSGDNQEALTGGRKSASYIARKIRTLLGRESVRKQVHTDIESGVDYIAPETTQTDLNGVVIVGAASMTVNMTALSVDTEELTGVIENIDWTGTVYRDSNGDDPSPLVFTGNADEG